MVTQVIIKTVIVDLSIHSGYSIINVYFQTDKYRHYISFIYYVMFIQFYLYEFKSVTALENLLVTCTSNSFRQTAHNDLQMFHFSYSSFMRR